MRVQSVDWCLWRAADSGVVMAYASMTLSAKVVCVHGY